ncbi:MAG: proline--tRNA ligase, partial [Lachnospiraceae bacterium]
GQAIIVRRDTREKLVVSLDELADKIGETLEIMQNDMLERAKAHLASHIYEAKTYDEFKDIVENKPGFIKMMWCGDQACEMKIKEDTTATSRCMPFEQEQITDVCPVCGRPAKKMVFWGKAY